MNHLHITNDIILLKARYNGMPLSTMQTFIDEHMRSVLTRWDLLSSFSTVTVLPPQISSQFTDEELCLLIGTVWLKALPLNHWIKVAFDTLGVTQEAKKLPNDALNTLCTVLHVLAEYHGETSLDISFLKSFACIPVQSRKLVFPSTAYLGNLATGGFEGLPIVQCYAIDETQERSFVNSETIQKLFIALEVRQHIDTKYIFEQFDKGKLKWNRQQIVEYLTGR